MKALAGVVHYMHTYSTYSVMGILSSTHTDGDDVCDLRK